jgi:hypothetical protein
MSHPSVPPEQRTMLTPTAAGDLAREPIPGMEVCDFCSETPVAWAYPCGLVVLGPNVTSDPWAACQECHDLIEAGDADQLARRAARNSDAPITLLPVFAELHRRFFAARQGEPRRV